MNRCSTVAVKPTVIVKEKKTSPLETIQRRRIGNIYLKIYIWRISDWRPSRLASYNVFRLDGENPETFLATSTYLKYKKIYEDEYLQYICNILDPKGI
jgi:hypothetical protein